MGGGGGGYSFLDIGCGEGWTLDVMHDNGFEIKGIDFSSYGINHHNPHLIPYFSQGDIYEQIQVMGNENKKYDVIFIGNVIEHVISPERLIEGIKNLLKLQSLLIIVAPNDYSDLQKELLETGMVEKPYWLAYPDHISYFNYDSMRNFLIEFGFSIKACLGDFPIELNLFSKLTNYVKDSSVGPDIHKSRVLIDNYLFDKDMYKALELSILLGDLRIGRNLIYFCEVFNR